MKKIVSLFVLMLILLSIGSVFASIQTYGSMGIIVLMALMLRGIGELILIIQEMIITATGAMLIHILVKQEIGINLIKTTH